MNTIKNGNTELREIYVELMENIIIHVQEQPGRCCSPLQWGQYESGKRNY